MDCVAHRIVSFDGRSWVSVLKFRNERLLVPADDPDLHELTAAQLEVVTISPRGQVRPVSCSTDAIRSAARHEDDKSFSSLVLYRA